MPRNQDNFIYNQLIPYIGNKRRLVPLIEQAIQKTGVNSGVFFDVFAGSGVVSRLAKVLGYQVISNDWEPYSYTINHAYIKQNRPPAFRKLGGMQKALDILNNLKPVKGYIATHYCPKNDENPEPDKERMFYTQENGRRIDAIREKIEKWSRDKTINENEKRILLAPLIFQGAYCSNTSGVFKAYHRGWGGSTSTALYRIRSRLTIDPPLFHDNHKENEVYKEDANKLASNIKCDIAYIDPPYNQHQYGSNYHLLSTIDLWDKPEINKEVLINGDTINKAAIRLDWRTERRSLYCYRDSATEAFRELIGKLKARFILVSYSTDGLIDFDTLLDMFADKGHLDIVLKRYKRYRVSSQRYSGVDVDDRGHNTEFVIVIDSAKRSSRENIVEIKQVLSQAIEPQLIDRRFPLSYPGIVIKNNDPVVKVAFRSEQGLTAEEERKLQDSIDLLKKKL
jgi:adenine-specific DNA-methyltransferase